MDARKSELRQIVVDVIFGKEKTSAKSDAYNYLPIAVTEVLDRRAGLTNVKLYENRLSETDQLLVEEIYWDLIIERVITPTMVHANVEYPYYRLHSDADSNLKSGSS
jgi:hypothetical protein